MALFAGEDMVSVQAPDGRTLTLPRSLVPAAMMPPPAQNIGLPSVSSEVPGGPGALPSQVDQIPSVTGGQLPTQPEPAGAPPVAAPDIQLPAIDMPALKKQRDEQMKRDEATRKASAAFNATPRGQVAGALDAQHRAIDEQSKAEIGKADVEAAGQLVTADAYKTRNDELDKMFVQRQKDAQDDLAEQTKKQAELETQRKVIANTKIDRSLDHPILMAISAALVGIGEARDKKPITSMNLIFDAIDRKVAGQMADLEQKKTIIGFTKDELTTLKDKATSRLALNNLFIAGETEKAARQVEEIAARTGSATTKANATIMAAQLRGRSADLTMAAVQHQNEYDQKDRHQAQDLGFKYTQLKEQGRQHDDEMQVKREEIYADQLKAETAAKASGDNAAAKRFAELQKDNEERGISNVATGDRLLTQHGLDQIAVAQRLTDEADRIEQSAKGPLTQGASARVTALRDRASEIRGTARVQDAFRSRDPVIAGKLSDEYASGQSIVTLTDDIKNIYDDTGKSFVSTDAKRAAIQAKTTELMMKLKTAWQLGVLSKRDADLINTATGGDPTKGWETGNIASKLGLDIGTDPEAFKARLDSLATGVRDETYNKLRIGGWDVKDPEQLFHSKSERANSPVTKATQDLNAEKSPLEDAKDASGVNVVRKGLDQVWSLGGVLGDPAYVRREKEAVENGSLKYGGLSKKQGEDLDTLLKAYQSGNAGAGARLVQQAIDPSRPELSTAIMHGLRDTAPKLYATARAQIKTGPVDEQLSYEEKNRIGAAGTPIDMLMQQAVVGDKESFDELARRAGDGDKDARRALDGVILNRKRQGGR